MRATDPQFRRKEIIVMVIFAVFAFLALHTPSLDDRGDEGNKLPPVLSGHVEAPVIHGGLPAQAAQALKLARRWEDDAALVEIDVEERVQYMPVFLFYSPTAEGGFRVTTLLHTMTDTPISLPGDIPRLPLPGGFLDLPDALALARQQGMSPVPRSATLAMTGQPPAPVWTLVADEGWRSPIFRVDAAGQ